MPTEERYGITSGWFCMEDDCEYSQDHIGDAPNVLCLVSPSGNSWWYRTGGFAQAKAHHEATGHQTRGIQVLEMWYEEES